MASVNLGQVFVNLLDDPAQYVSAFSARGLTDVRSLAGSLRAYGSGRIRAITTPHDSRTLDLTLLTLTSEEVLALQSWRGRTVCVRDSNGRKVYGVFFEITVADYIDRPKHDVALTLSRVTATEEV